MSDNLLSEISDLILETTREHTVRRKIIKGQTVDIVLKKNQRTGILTRGKVWKILSPGQIHTRGIKVMLTDGSVGRVQSIISDQTGLN
jgi:uncharacterized repeat protein (TIGR03833 family)